MPRTVDQTKAALAEPIESADGAEYVPEWKIAFPEFTAPENTLSGIKTAFGTKEQIKTSRADLIGTAEDVAIRNHIGYNSSYHQGYYVDDLQHEIYLCNVYRWQNETVCPECDSEESAEDSERIAHDAKGNPYREYVCPSCEYKYHESEERPLTWYFAMTESNESDCVWLDPEIYESDMDAARASDHLAERLAETERNYNSVWQKAGKCAMDLKEANDMRRNAIEYERQARRHVAELMASHENRVSCFALRWIHPAAWRTIETMRAEARRLWDLAEDSRESVFREIGEHKPSFTTKFNGANWYEAWKAGELTDWQAENASYMDAWTDGWQV